MPVVATAVAIGALFYYLSGKDGASFLNPAALRKRIEKLPDGERRTGALGLLSELDGLAASYRRTNLASIEEFLKLNAQKPTTTQQLIAQRHTADAELQEALDNVLRIRESMRKTLSREEWDKVFR